MSFAIELKGQSHVIESVAPCFVGGFAQIRKLGNVWALESSEFDSCTKVDEIVAVATRLIQIIHRVLALYARLASPFELGSVYVLDESGAIVRSVLRATAQIRVYLSAGLHELSVSNNAQSLGTRLVRRAFSEEELLEALAIVGEDDIKWSQIYDIIEFLGGCREIAKRNWATAREVDRFRRTANHYRHLGNPGRNPLPPNPPTLAESCTFAVNLLKQWIAKREQ